MGGRMRVSKFSSLIALGVIAVPGASLAAGLYVPDSGTTARARGGAFCVAADDPLAIFYNPAGLADQHTRNQFLFDITDLQLNEKFQRTGIPPDGASAGTTATNAPPPQIVPNILYVHNFSDKFSLGGGIHAPAGGRYKFSATGPQRFTNSELYLVEAGIGISAAYRIHRVVSVGLTLETLMTSVDQRFAVSKNTPPNPPTEDPLQESPGHVSAASNMTPTGILGVKVTPVEGIEFGLSYRPSVTLNMPGKLETSNPDTSDKLHFHSKLASILRIGARYVKPTWDYELDFVYEDWSVHKEDKVTADDGNFIGGSTQSVPRNWKAAYSIRGGSTFKLSEKLHGMAGWFYETSAVPKEYLDVGSYDAPKVGLNFGAKYDFGTRFTAAANLSHVFMASQTVTNSKQRQQGAFSPPLTSPSDFTVIGNGKYTGDYNMIGLSLLTKF